MSDPNPNSAPADSPPAESSAKGSYWRRNRFAAILLLILAVLGGGLYIRSRLGKPNRVMALPTADTFLGVRAGKPVFQTAAGEVALYEVHPDSGRKSPILRGAQIRATAGVQALGAEGVTPEGPKADADLEQVDAPKVDGTISSVSVRPEGILFYVREDSPEDAEHSSRVTGNPGGPGRMTLGGPALSDVPQRGGLQPGNSPVITRAEMAGARPVPTPSPFTTYFISRQGGTPVSIGKGVTSYATGGDQPYWIIDHEWTYLPARATIPPKNGTTIRPILPPCDVLMTASPDGSQPRRVGVQLPEGTRLISGNQGVFWLEPSTRPTPLRAMDTPQVLCYLANGTSAPARLKDFYCLGSPVDLAGRVFWLVEAPANPNAGQEASPDSTEVVIRSAPRDLSGVEDVGRSRLSASQRLGVTASNPGNRSNPGLRAHDGRAYAVLLDGTKAAGVRPPRDPQDISPESRPRLSIFRLDATSKPSLTRLVTLPMDSREIVLDGAYAYFISLEYKENWLDWSGTGLQTSMSSAIFRVPLDG